MSVGDTLELVANGQPNVDQSLIDSVKRMCLTHGKPVVLQIFSECCSAQELHNCAIRKRYHEDEDYRKRKYAATLKSYKKSYHENEEFRLKKLAKKREYYHRKKLDSSSSPT